MIIPRNILQSMRESLLPIELTTELVYAAMCYTSITVVLEVNPICASSVSHTFWVC